MQNKINLSTLNAKIAQEIVQFKRFDLLVKHFPTAKQMVEYSNFVPQYPQRKNSVLALLVQSGDAFLLRRFWDFYFVKQSAPAECEEKFLDGTDAAGQMINYHYFRNDAPFEVLREEAAFRNVDCADFNYSLTPKQAARWKIYSFLKQKRKSLEKKKPLSVNISPFERKFDASTKTINEAVTLPNSGAWQKDVKPFDKVVFVRDKENFSEQVDLDIASDVSFTEQVFRNADFPDEFFWAGDMLRLWNKAFPKFEKNEAALFFAKNNGVLMLHQDRSSQKLNLKSGNDASAYLQYNNDDFLVFGINYKKCYLEEKYFQNIIRHELTHGVDLFDDKVCSYEFSESDFMKFCDVLLYQERHNFVRNVVNYYSPEDRRVELLAKIMERDSEAVNNHPLIPSIKNSFTAFTKWRLENNQQKIEQFNGLVRKNLGEHRYNKWCEVFDAFEDYAASDTSFDWKHAWDKPDAKNEKKFRAFLSHFYKTLGTGERIVDIWENKLAHMADDFLDKNSSQKRFSALDLFGKNIKNKEI